MERVLQLKQVDLLHVWEWLRNFTLGAHCEPSHASTELAYRLHLVSNLPLCFWFDLLLLLICPFLFLISFRFFAFSLSYPLLPLCFFFLHFLLFVHFLSCSHICIWFLNSIICIISVLFITFPPHLSCFLPLSVFCRPLSCLCHFCSNLTYAVNSWQWEAS